MLLSCLFAIFVYMEHDFLFFLANSILLITILAFIIARISSRVKAHKITKALDKKPWRPTWAYPRWKKDGERILFFDTETTGLPKDPDADASEDDNWPRLVSLSWIVARPDKTIISQEHHVIKPDGFTIPKKASKVHGITTEKALAEGEDLTKVLNLFLDDFFKCGLAVGHNITFDQKVVGSELLRIGKNNYMPGLPCCDTMRSSVWYCRIPRKDGRYKMPSLWELYWKLFREGFTGAHDSLSDTKATMECFFELVRQGVIQLTI